MRLTPSFFDRNTVQVARDLLGKFLVRRQGQSVIAAKIIETEAYCGQSDLACHASKGLTPRTKILFGPPGHTYIYLIYGMYYCLNFVTRKPGQPEAVLIRAVDLLGADGPGKLTRAFKIDRSLNDLPPDNTELWIEDPAPRRILVRGKPSWVWSKTPRSRIKATKRIGVEYAGPWASKLWRFVLK